MKTSLWVSLIAVLALGGGVWLWQDYAAKDEAAPPALATATRGTVTRTVLASGVIEAKSLVSVGARVSGQIEALHVTLGQRVAQGDLIAEIDDDDQQNAVLQAEATLKQIEAQIAAQKATITEAELAVSRKRTLNDRALTSTEDLEAAQASLAVAEANLDALNAQRAQAEVSLASTRTELERTKITAPISGTVVAVVADQGQTVNANTSSPTLVKLAELDRMVVKAEISEADVVDVRPGQPVSFTLLGAPDLKFPATLRDIEPAPDSIETEDEIATDTAIYYNALLDVDNPDGVLRIGMTAQVTIELDRAENVVTIPSGALGARQPDGRYRVSLYDPATNGTSPRLVRVGLNNNVTVAVIEGLEEGDRVVAAGSASTRPASGTGNAGRRRPMLGF